MNDLISRKALLAEYDRVHIGEPGKARKLIEDTPAVQEWISVKDRLPSEEENGEHILVCYSDGWICDQYTPVDDGVTHWMPLPQPPKGE